MIRLRHKDYEPVFLDPKTKIVYFDAGLEHPVPKPYPEWIEELLANVVVEPKKEKPKRRPREDDTPIFVSRGIIDERPAREIVRKIKDII